jgi:outer membrane protein insertion porin family
MNRSLAWLAGLCLLVLISGTASPVPGQPPEIVRGVDLISAQELPSDLVRAAIGNLLGLPRSRATIHDSLERIWSLGLFSEVWVDEVQEPDGIRLRFHLVRRPQIRQIQWLGKAVLPLIDLVEAANLSIGGDGGTDRLEEARRRILAAYSRGGFFAAHVTVRTRDDPATNAQDVTITLEAGSHAEIGIVTLDGVPEAEAARLTEKLRLEPGDEYSEAAARRSAQAVEEGLRQDGYYETRINLLHSVWDPASNRVNLEFEAAEGPKYLVEFSGVQELSESTLRARLSFQDAGTVDETEVDTNARAIEAVYQEAGFAFAKVSGSLEPAADPQQIRFAVIEGPRVIVESISFSGNQAFPATRLQEQMETRLPGLFARGAFRQDVLDRDLRVLTAFYRTQGYPDVVVGPADVQLSEDHRAGRILIPIIEGPHLSVGTIAVEGVTLFPASEVLTALPFKTGDPWTKEREAEARRSIARLYAQRGYLRAQITFEAAPQENRLDLAIRIQEGAQTRVGRILISGLISTKDYVVRRELPFAPGDPFNPEALADAERRLAGLGIFDRVQIGPLQPPPAPFADVSITLREGRPWRVEFGGGYSSSDGWRAVVEAGHDNLFGTGQSASIRQKLSQYGDRTDLTYRYPWLFGTPLRGDLSGFQEYHDQHTFGYKQQQEGIAAGIERTLLPVPFKDLYRLRLGLRYQLAWIRNYDVSPSLQVQATNPIVPGTEIVAKITPAVTMDYRDNVLDPKTGSFHTLSLDLAGPYLGGQASFVKTSMETKWFFEGPLQTTFALGARLGLATPSGSSTSLPTTERFYAGGSTTIRGYAQDKVGPLDSNGNPLGGDTMVIGNVEWRFPIWRWLGGVAFLDTGTVTPEVGNLSLSGFKTGVGGGLRITTPIGPIRIDAGYALNPIPGSGRWQFYLAIGHAF